MKEFFYHLSRGAGEILRASFGKRMEHREKKDAGFVTQADIESEEFIIAGIRKAYPQSDILAEESGESSHAHSWKWIIDPLDGTTNYGNGIPFFAVSIALEEEGDLTHAAVYNPVTEELFYAEKGGGAWFKGEPLRAGGRQELSKAVLATGDMYYRDEKFETEMTRLRNVYKKCRALRLTGSVALALAWTAAGRYDGFWLENCNYWDIAAGALLVREAGGMVTDFAGKEYGKGSASSLVAANPALLPAILGAVQQ
jgi:myo-inositol-1(or 4)-monophosphatase